MPQYHSFRDWPKTTIGKRTGKPTFKKPKKPKKKRCVDVATYASTAIAEASGDLWCEGAEITITGGPVFIFNANRAVKGAFGLLHKEPYGSGLGTLAASVVRGSELADSDPDAWTSGWADASSGVKGVDYEFDTASNLSRLRDLTTAGVAKLNSTVFVVSSDLESFRVIDVLSTTTAGESNSNEFTNVLQLQVYKDGVDRNWISLENGGQTVNWRVNHTNFSTFANTLRTRIDPRRVYMYVKNGRWAVWFDDDATPVVSGTVPREAADGGSENYVAVQSGSTAGTSGVNTMLLGTDIFGNMTTA